jgi:hypothetical protein
VKKLARYKIPSLEGAKMMKEKEKEKKDKKVGATINAVPRARGGGQLKRRPPSSRADARAGWGVGSSLSLSTQMAVRHFYRRNPDSLIRFLLVSPQNGEKHFGKRWLRLWKHKLKFSKCSLEWSGSQLTALHLNLTLWKGWKTLRSSLQDSQKLFLSEVMLNLVHFT